MQSLKPKTTPRDLCLRVGIVARHVQMRPLVGEGNSPLPRTPNSDGLSPSPPFEGTRNASDRTHGLSSSGMVGATPQEFYS